MAEKLPPLVYRLGWISFFADVCSEMAYPVMPLFIVGTLQAPKTALGVIEGVALAVVALMRAWSGFASDRSGRRIPFIQWGYLTAGLSKPVIGLAYVWPTVLGARVLDRLGKGLRTTARDALLADTVDRADYGRAFGFHQGMDTAGAFFGVMLSFLLLWIFPGQYRLIFIIAAGPGLVAWLITLTLREKPRTKEPKADRAPFDWSGLSPAYWRAVIISAIFALANSSDTFVMLRAQGVFLAARDDPATAARMVVLAYALYNLVFSLFSYPIGKLSDRVGRWPALLGGWLIYALVYFGFAGATGSSIWILFAVYGIATGIETAVNKALVADLAPGNGRGAAMGVFYLVMGAAVLIANPLTGWVWDRFGPGAAFKMGAALALLAAALIPLCGALRRASPANAG